MDCVLVYLVAALAIEQGVDGTLEYHPGLTHTQVVAVAENVWAYPKSGQPYLAQSFKRMLGELADLGAFDPAETDIEGDARPAR